MYSIFTEMLPDSRLILAVLLHFIWQATLVVSMVAVCKALIHPRLYQTRYICFVAGLVAILIAPLVTLVYYICNPGTMMALDPHLVSTVADQMGPVEMVTATGWMESQFQIVFAWFDNHRLFWLGTWMAGFGLLVLRLGISFGHCLRIRKQQQPLPGKLERISRQLKQKMNIAYNVVVASSQNITQAVATGIIKPVVLIPASWVTHLSVPAIEAVIAHELAHIRRWDLWINLLQRILETVFFFHPLVWWLSRTISQEREVCCDQLAIRVTGKPLRYVETLAHVAGTATLNDLDFQFSTAFVGGKKMNLLRRAKMILEPASLDARSPVRSLTLVVFMGLLATCGSYAWCTTPDPATSQLQEHDVFVVQEDSHQQDTGDSQKRDGRFVWIVEGDDDARDPAGVLHMHLKQLLHEQDGQHDSAKLARQLRRLADQLEGQKYQLHQNRFVLRDDSRDDEKRILVEANEAGEYAELRFMERHPEHDRVIHRLHRSDDQPEMIVELKTDGKARVRSHDDKVRRVRVRRKKGDPKVEVHADVRFEERAAPHPSHERVRVRLKKGDPKVEVHADVRFEERDGPHRPHERTRLRLKKGEPHVEVQVIEDFPKEPPHERVRLRRNKGDQQVEVHVIEGDGPHPPHERIRMHVQRSKGQDIRVTREFMINDRDEPHPPHGDASTSEDELGSVIRDLRNEVRQLRREVKQMRNRGGKTKVEFRRKGSSNDNHPHSHDDDGVSDSSGMNREVAEFVRASDDPISKFRDLWIKK